MISSTNNLVRVGNVVNFADIENNLRAQPLSDQLLTSGYLSLDGADLSVENLQVSSGIINNSPFDLDTYGTYSLEFDPSFTGSIELTYDIVSSSGERVSVSRELNVVDNVDDSVEFPFAWGWDRQASEGVFATRQSNLSTYIREFTRSDGANADKWDPKVVQQGNSTTIFSQMLTDALSNPNDPTIADVYGGSTTPVLITNLTAANGTFSSSTVRNRGTVQYTPDPGFAGVDTITYDFTTFDGFVYSVTKSIEVAPTDYSTLTIEAPEPSPPSSPLIEAGVEGVDFWYDGGISPNFDNDAFWYRGAAPLEEGGDSKYWFKFKNTSATDELTNGGEYALVATLRDALDDGAIIDELTGQSVFSKSFTSPDGIRLYAGIDETAIQELSNFGAEDIEVYVYDVAAEQIVGTDGREILGSRLDNQFDTIGEEYAGSLSEQYNNAYLDTLA